MSCSRGKANPDAATRLRLFVDSGGHCQRPACRQRLFLDVGGKTIHIAEMAHIFAASAHGPRPAHEMNEAERGAYENLILLCPTCHTIVDKAPEAYPDSEISEWKRGHVDALRALFGAVEYTTRAAARAAIEPSLIENTVVFTDLSPDNDYREDPESEQAAAWKVKVLGTLLPNNRKILAILEANRKLLAGSEAETLAAFRQHIEDLERRHLGEGDVVPGRRFPVEMEEILTEQA